MKKGYLCFAVLTVCAVLLGLKLCPPAVQEADAAQWLAQKDEIQVLSGAPAGGEYVNCTRRQLLQGTLLQVSAKAPLPEDFPAPNVRGVRAVVGAYLPAREETALTRETIQALCDMQYDHPLENVTITRGGVSAAQQNLCRREVFENLSLVCSLEEAAARSREVVPAGGESEHQLGTAFDLVLTGVTEMGRADAMEWNETGLWLRENMWRYGFVRRGAPEHQDHERHVCDALHVRYVGTVHAAAMQAGNWCLEEYLQVLRTNGAITVCVEGQRDAYVYWLPCEGNEGMTVMLPSRYGDCSLDNAGGAVFTCMEQ